MKHKKFLTVTLLTAIIIAVSLLTSLESQMPTEVQPSAAKQEVPLAPGAPTPKVQGFAPVNAGVNYPQEEIYQTLSPLPSGCTLNQDSVEALLNDVNLILDKALIIANILYQQPSNLQAPNNNLNTILSNRLMPQDTTPNCKVLQDNVAYIAKLMTILAENILYAVPSNAAAIA